MIMSIFYLIFGSIKELALRRSKVSTRFYFSPTCSTALSADSMFVDTWKFWRFFKIEITSGACAITIFIDELNRINERMSTANE